MFCVANTYHFAYDDGKEYYPCGTTCYVWELQSKETQEKTYESLASSPFNKIRFCVFPKHYVYNLKEPAQYPFEIRENSPWSPSDFETEKLEKAPRNMFGGIDAMIENPDEVWDYTRPNPSYFERRQRKVFFDYRGRFAVRGVYVFAEQPVYKDGGLSFAEGLGGERVGGKR